MKQLYLILGLLAVAGLGFSQNPTFPPRDETYLDPSLDAFVQQLSKAIDSRDRHFVYDAVDIDVAGAIGMSTGINDFIEEWNIKDDSSRFWPMMKRVIELGGVFLHDTADLTGRYQFVFPYVYDMPLDLEDDYYSIGVVTGKNVNLRDKPDTASPIKTKLSYDVIWYLQGDDFNPPSAGTNPYGQPEWYYVETYDRQIRGWVNWKYVCSPMDARMFLFKNDKGVWKISAFVEGD